VKNIKSAVLAIIMYNRRKNKGNICDGPGGAAPKGEESVLNQKNQDHNATHLLLTLMILIILATVITGTFLLAVGGAQTRGSKEISKQSSHIIRGATGVSAAGVSAGGGGDHDLILKPHGEHVDMEAHLDDLLHSIGGVVHQRLVDLGAAVRDNDPCFSLIDKGWSALLVDKDDTQSDKWKNRFPSGD